MAADWRVEGAGSLIFGKGEQPQALWGNRLIWHRGRDGCRSPQEGQTLPEGRSAAASAAARRAISAAVLPNVSYSCVVCSTRSAHVRRLQAAHRLARST